ncbi:hypothetical protein D1815_06295 [Aquimarina sp. AD1]|uniref:hypothetical protein n=1 Tax=Aquimarina sp. (strain AD1) TaxID=1714848 RepID=UPI000E4B2BCB|nr:hypothetical protein [Aquimarina sp. AD1]AXT55385.1 hypothetical protein D1815_06295 [Aquimarina sp. AD1]RKN28711.1 hypothetical protein D7035_07690 [Aquimarina sp. AD1]
MDKNHKTEFQKLIVQTLGEKYTLHKTEESSKYILGFWKHVDYEADDDRGGRIGPGPVVFIKATKEYKMLGSGDLVYGDYFDEFKEEDDKDGYDGWQSIEEIKEGILKRRFVNERDIVTVVFKAMEEIGEFKFNLNHVDPRKSMDTYIFISESKEARNKVIWFLEYIGIPYDIKETTNIIFDREIK